MAACLLKEVIENDYQHTPLSGAGHLKESSKSYNRAVSIIQKIPSKLDTIPASSNWFKYIPWLIVLAILFGFAIGFNKSTEMGMAMVIDWVLINGGLSALGALIALAHPLTILTAWRRPLLTQSNDWRRRSRWRSRNLLRKTASWRF